jgi:cytoplasmic FMR1 interacting protein
VQLLGRSVDLRTLMVERLNASLRLDIEQAISRFESNDLTGICELQQTLSILRETRDRLSHMLDDGGGDVGRSKGSRSSTSLDDYDMILSEMNESVSSPEGSTGRIGRHVLIELVRDVYPNWLYNEVSVFFSSLFDFW